MCYSLKLFIMILWTELWNKQPWASFSRINVNIAHDPPEEPHTHTPPSPFKALFYTSTIQDNQQSKTSFHTMASSSLPTTETETQKLFPLTLTLLHMSLFICISCISLHFSKFSYSHLHLLSSCGFFPYSDDTLFQAIFLLSNQEQRIILITPLSLTRKLDQPISCLIKKPSSPSSQ